MHNTSKNHEQMPYNVHTRDTLHIIKKHTDGIKDSAKHKIPYTDSADCSVIRPESKYDSPTRNKIENLTDFVISLNAYYVQNDS